MRDENGEICYWVNPEEYFNDPRIQKMTCAEEGAYLTALNICWLEGSLPADTKALAKTIGRGCTIKMAEVAKQMFIPHPLDETRLIDIQQLEEMEANN